MPCKPIDYSAMPVIFTDLDGTLLDHHNYHYEPAKKALALIERQRWPLIMVSSKTASEINMLQQTMSLATPFICENGAAVYWREKGQLQHHSFSVQRSQWLEKLTRLQQQHGYHYKGFSDMSSDEIAALTGLDERAAALAASREYSEPLHWCDTEQALEQFRLQLQGLGLRAVRGGRFVTVMGQTDKATAMAWLMARYQQEKKCVAIALGDSENDSQMLEAADIAVVIRSEQSNNLNPQQPALVIRSQACGPQGWQAALWPQLQRFIPAAVKE